MVSNLRRPHVSRQLKRLFCAFAASAACTTALAVPPLWISDLDGTLGSVDLSDGAVTIVGQMRVIMSDIAFDASGQLWGVSAASALYRIERNTAAVTLVRGIDQHVNSLVFGPDGQLYAANTELMTLNPQTAAVTFIGGWGGYWSSGDLAFVGGSLYLSSRTPNDDTLFRLDRHTGAGTQVGSGITAGTVYGMATDDNVHLYGVSGNRVLSIDPVTGVGHVIQTYNPDSGLGQAYGTAFTSEAAAPVPEPATAWLLGLGLLCWALRRWHQQGRGAAHAA